MSREIKFRAWDNDLKYFIYFEVGKLLPICDELDEYTKLSIRGVEWQEYTGLKDKNGKEIYEGDIVTFPWISPMGEPEDKHSYYGKILFKDGCFIMNPIKSDCGYWNNKQLINLIKPEIIGNIYENPELIKIKSF